MLKSDRIQVEWVRKAVPFTHPLKARFRKKPGLGHFWMMNLCRVYLLENEESRRYIGISEDVHERLKQNNAGVSKWTAKHRPWELAWTSAELSLSDAAVSIVREE